MGLFTATTNPTPTTLVAGLIPINTATTSALNTNLDLTPSNMTPTGAGFNASIFSNTSDDNSPSKARDLEYRLKIVK